MVTRFLLRRLVWVTISRKPPDVPVSEQLLTAVRAMLSWQDLTVETTRRAQELAVAWRIQQEIPESDLREEIDEIVRTWDDQMARLTEQIVT